MFVNLFPSYNKYIFTLRLHLIVEFLIFYFYFNRILTNSLIKKILLVFTPIFLVYNVFDYFSIGDFSFGNTPTLIEFLVYISSILFFFFEVMKNFSKDTINSINFWICVGLFVYFTGNFFYILLVEYSAHASAEVKNQLKLIYSIVTIAKNVLLGLAFFANNNKETSDTYYSSTDGYYADTVISENNL